jgi:hypothetical protein
LYLYIKGRKFAKYMSSACTAELRERIEGDIISLHEARNQVEFDYVFETMRVVWTNAGGAGFAAYFKRHYATGVWARWWYGASFDTQNLSCWWLQGSPTPSRTSGLRRSRSSRVSVPRRLPRHGTSSTSRASR